jgi:hypothetical protein
MLLKYLYFLWFNILIFICEVFGVEINFLSSFILEGRDRGFFQLFLLQNEEF